MCGIVGIASVRPEPEPESLDRMRDTLRHRGPDGAGCWWNAERSVGLGHRRLAIIDLSPSGHQPMIRGPLAMTFNGEIYNYLDLRDELCALGHRFRSQSDTEVVLAAYQQWGASCIDRLNGMFALALYDGDQRRVLLARDRAGEKPLYYTVRNGRLAFASELKALMADATLPRRLDPSAVLLYLAYGYVPGGHCILQDVHKLPPAHALTFDIETGSSRCWRYWDLPAPPTGPADAAALVEEFDSLLADAVRRQLIADVPVGVLLSGGIDSSLVAAMAVRAKGPAVRTFTISFPGAGEYDEGPIARQVATHLGTHHVELVAEPTTVELLPRLAAQYDEPMADSSMVPTYLVSRLIRQHATVALGGDGGDELFGGYNHYSWIQRQHAIRLVPAPFRRLVAEVAARALPPGLRGRNHLIGLTGSADESIAHINLYFDRWTRRRLLSPAPGLLSAAGRPEDYRLQWANHAHSLLRRATETDFRSTMVDAYLVKVDRASMLNSLEVRAPFLDYRVIDFAFGRVPDSLRATTARRKILPKQLAARLMPPGFDLERKQGFSLPLHRWFRGPWGDYFREVLAEADPAIFDRAVIAQLLEGQERGYANMARLFSLTMFELWRREYGVSLS